MKQKLRILLLLSICLFTLLSCTQPTNNNPSSDYTYVRFQNLCTYYGAQWAVSYGVKFGDAVHDSSLGYASATKYYPITKGTYSVMGKTANGTWITISNGSMSSPSSSGKYTLSMQGDWVYGTITFSLIQDN
jgi:hypothetical protein